MHLPLILLYLVLILQLLQIVHDVVGGASIVRSVSGIVVVDLVAVSTVSAVDTAVVTNDATAVDPGAIVITVPAVEAAVVVNTIYADVIAGIISTVSDIDTHVSFRHVFVVDTAVVATYATIVDAAVIVNTAYAVTCVVKSQTMYVVNTAVVAERHMSSVLLLLFYCAYVIYIVVIVRSVLDDTAVDTAHTINIAVILLLQMLYIIGTSNASAVVTTVSTDVIV